MTVGKVDNAMKVQKLLQTEVGTVVSNDTIRRTLRGSGLGAVEKPRERKLTKIHGRKRLAWCKAHRDWTIDDWKRVIWSDETKINSFNSDGRVWA